MNESQRIRRLSIRVAALSLWLLFVTVAILQPTSAQSDQREVIVIEADGPVIPPLRAYIERGIQEAEDSNAEALVIVLNTPGGSVTVTQKIVESMRASRVPIIVYVAPRGAFAASAGTIITLAGHAAAMAPETAIGAASPVSGQGQDLPETLQNKTEELLSAQARGLAERRGPEAVALADEAVREARAVAASEALAANFVDSIANDIDDLLDQLDGFEVEVDGQSVNLRTAGAVQRPLPRSFIEQIFTVIVDPTIVFVFMSIGTTAIIIEIGSPGGWVAGAIGVTSLGLGLYGLGVLPVNWLGIIFIIMAFILFLIDIKATSHGALTAGGILSLVAGSVILFDTPAVQPFGQLSIPIVILVSLVIAGIFSFIISFAIRAQSRTATTGLEGMPGRSGTVVEALAPHGTVLVASERWKAISDDGHLPAGARIEVVSVEEFTLSVRLVELPEQADSDDANPDDDQPAQDTENV